VFEWRDVAPGEKDSATGQAKGIACHHGLTAREVLGGVQEAVVIEEHPNFPKGPCALFLQKDQTGQPIHVVWGIPKGHDRPAVLVTGYRPDPGRWDKTFTRRR
jgi:hypothetical protein